MLSTLDLIRPLIEQDTVHDWRFFEDFYNPVYMNEQHCSDVTYGVEEGTCDYDGWLIVWHYYAESCTDLFRVYRVSGPFSFFFMESEQCLVPSPL